MFIDTHYDIINSTYDIGNFTKYTQKLWEFADQIEPFECKDIVRAQLEIEKLKDQIEQLKADKKISSFVKNRLESESKRQMQDIIRIRKLLTTFKLS